MKIATYLSQKITNSFVFDRLSLLVGDRRYYHRNFERIADYNLPKDFYKDRPHGLSAMMRIKNDEKWISYAIRTILPFVDEVVIVLQNSTDKTEDIIRSLNSTKIKLYKYQYDSFPSGVHHNNYLKDSVFNRAYYYNFALSKTSYSYVWKWDGDHAAIESRVEELRGIVDSKRYDVIHAVGYDMYGKDLQHVCKDPYCSNEPWIFRVNRFSYYFSGKIYEEFSYPKYVSFLKRVNIYNYPKPLFLHFKYLNPIGKGWETTWKEDGYFQKFTSNKIKGDRYEDEYPKLIIEEYLGALSLP